MLNKLCLSGLGLLLASSAFAQTAPSVTTTTYSNPVTITSANGCLISGITTLTYDGNQSITTNGTAATCNPTGGPPPQVATVSVSISPATYLLNSGAAAPVVTVTNLTPAATVTCTLSPTNGFTATPSSVTNSGTFTLSTPSSAATFTFTPTCTTTTTGYTVAQPASVTLTVNPNGPPPPTSCSSTQVSSSVGGKTLQRQCTGGVSVQPGPVAGYNGDLTDLGKVLNDSTFPTYTYSGWAPTYTINSGYYIALAFKPSVSGGFQVTANQSYGDGGTIAVSTQPGSITQGSPGYVCGMSRGGTNGLYISTAGGVCTVTVGTTYYLNLADVDSQGNNLCYNGRAGSCTSSLVSYTIYSGN